MIKEQKNNLVFERSFIKRLNKQDKFDDSIVKILFLSALITEENTEIDIIDKVKAVESLKSLIISYLNTTEDVFKLVHDDDIYDMFKSIADRSNEDRIKMLGILQRGMQLISNDKITAVVQPEIESLPSGSVILITDIPRFSEGIYDFVCMFDRYNFVFAFEEHDEYTLYKKLYSEVKNVSIIMINISEKENTLSLYDHIVSIPVLSKRAREQGSTFISESYDMMVLEYLLLHLKHHAGLHVFLQESFNNESGESVILRKFIKESYHVKKAMTFPNQAFRPCTVVKICSYVIAREIPDNEDILCMSFSAQNNSCDEITGAPFIEKDSERYISFSDFYMKNKWNLYHENIGIDSVVTGTYELGKFAQIFRGIKLVENDIIKKCDGGKERTAVITVGNMSQYDYMNEPVLYHCDVTEKKKNLNMLKENDIMISARGTVFKMTMFSTALHKGIYDYDFIATENILVIRTDPERLDPYYLMLILESRKGKDMVLAMSRSGKAVNLNCKDVKALRVPLVSINEQRKYGRGYFKILKECNESIYSSLKRINDYREEKFKLLKD